MQLSHLLGAGVLIAAVGLSARSDANDANRTAPAPDLTATGTAAAPAAGPAAGPAAAPAPAPPTADGHFVLVVEGDRNALAVTFASKKAARWAGVPKGFDSNWRVAIHDAQGKQLADVPLDVSPFATDAGSVGKGPKVRGCFVVESKIGLLLNVPAFDAAYSYTFSRTEADGTPVALGTTSGDTIRELARGGR